MDSKVKEFLERFPFMSLIRYGEHELVGIIQNSDNVVVTMYVYNLLKTDEDKLALIEQGDEWWWVNWFHQLKKPKGWSWVLSAI